MDNGLEDDREHDRRLAETRTAMGFTFLVFAVATAICLYNISDKAELQFLSLFWAFIAALIRVTTTFFAVDRSFSTISKEYWNSVSATFGLMAVIVAIYGGAI